MSPRPMEVLIATHGRPELLEESLLSLLPACQDRLVSRIVVVENGGRDGAETICKHLAESGPVEYHWYREANKSMALNFGLGHCSDGLIFMTDDDIVIDPRVIATYAQASAAHPRKAFFGGPTDTRYEKEPDEMVKDLLPASARGWSSTPEAMLERGFFIGFNWAAYKTDLLEAGGFNPDFGPGGRTGATGQESEMQRRLREIGAKAIYLPDARVTHQVPAERCNPDWLLRRSYRQGVERGIVLAGNGVDAAKRHLLSEKRRNALFGLQAKLTFSRKRQYQHRFYAERIKGFEAALKLHSENRLSVMPKDPDRILGQMENQIPPTV